MTLQSKPMSIGLLHKLYGVAVTALLPLVATALLASRRGRRRFGERFGVWAPLGDIDWWLHGASVGEVQGLIPLIRAIRADNKGERILLTATSPTGLDRGESLVDEVRLLPIDVPFLMRRMASHAPYKRLVITETELWPNFLTAVHKANVPVHLINARISEYTYRWYRRSAGMFRPLLLGCRSISVPDEEQLHRFLSLGIPSEKVHLTGHTKYDAEPRYVQKDVRQPTRETLFPGISPDIPVLVLGSLRDGEERVWFPALQRAKSAGIPLRVVVAPRHAERFEQVFSQLVELGLPVARWSTGAVGLHGGHEVLLLDAMGLLEQVYAASDLAFVGGTLVDIGGHNPLEPAMYGVPVVVGPYTSVINDPVREMRSRRGIIEVRTEEDAFTTVSLFGSNDGHLRAVGRAGYEAYLTYRGAVSRVVSVIRESEAMKMDE